MNRYEFSFGGFVVAVLCVLVGGGLVYMIDDHEVTGGNAPPPYTPTDVNTAIVNSLGNAGRTEGFKTGVTSTTVDVLSAARLEFVDADLGAEMQERTVFPFMREVVVTLADDTAETNAAVCVRLGPASDGGSDTDTNPDGAPALACPNLDTTGITGGCYLFSIGQSCTFMIRPKISDCVDYESCHVPLWVRSSAAESGYLLNVAMIW